MSRIDHALIRNLLKWGTEELECCHPSVYLKLSRDVGAKVVRGWVDLISVLFR